MRMLRGQTLLEYTVLIGIVTVAIFYMSTAIKRGAQSMIKVAADQVGEQRNADQRVIRPSASDAAGSPQDTVPTAENTQGGYLVSAYTSIRTNNSNTKEDRNYKTNTIISEEMNMVSNALTDMGFTETR